MRMNRRTFFQVATGTALATTSRTAWAQAYPTRPVRLVVAFVPGGATDTLARQISNDLKEALGEAVVIENRPGAGGYIAWSHVAASEPDGHTLLLAENALGMSQALYRGKASSFNPLTQYDAVAGIATSPSALIVATHIPANTVAELVAYSKTVKGKMNYATAGVGSVSHLNFEVFKDAVGMEAVHIPYKGGGAAIADIVAGHVPMTITSVQGTKSLVESGKLKALAVTSLTRSPAMPHVPTMQEAGVKKVADVELRFWFGIFGPKGMPDAVKAKLEGALKGVLADQACAGGSPTSTSRRSSRPRPLCDRGSRPRSGAGPSSSTRGLSRRGPRSERWNGWAVPRGGAPRRGSGQSLLRADLPREVTAAAPLRSATRPHTPRCCVRSMPSRVRPAAVETTATRPLLRIAISSAISSTSRGFCSTRTIERPLSLSLRIVAMTSATICGARPSDGSSISSTRGLAISARPIASICCSPPERCAAY